MNLFEYLENHEGIGILSTANRDGEVNGAVYARPHVLEPGKVAFVMRERLSRANLLENGYAHFLFLEDAQKSKGVRLHLEMVDEIKDTDIIKSYSRRKRVNGDDENKYLVKFKVRKALQLIGGQEILLH